MSRNYLENYLDSIEKLPYDLQRKFNLIQELDEQVKTMTEAIDDCAKAFYMDGNTLTKEERAGFRENVMDTFKKCIEVSEDKVTVAVQAYDLVDKHIRRLDSDMSRFDHEDGDGMVAEEEKTPNQKRRKNSSNGGSARKNRKLNNSASKRGSTATQAVGTGNIQLDIEMPVDPNEPTYCICNQVSFGEMIACDNPECTLEWFHFQCVGLTVRPKGKWFCPRCSVEKK